MSLSAPSIRGLPMILAAILVGSCQFAEGVRVMTGRGGTVAEKDTTEQLAPIARDLAGHQPRPILEIPLTADQTDLVEFVGNDRLLVGEIQLSTALAVPSFGDLCLYDLSDGAMLWRCPRPELMSGSYALLANAPVLLVQGIAPDSAEYLGLDPASGKLAWQVTLHQPQVGVLSREGDLLMLLGEEPSGCVLSAVRVADGSTAWRQVLPASVKAAFDARSLWIEEGSVTVAVAGAVHRIATGNGDIAWSAVAPGPAARMGLARIAGSFLVWGGQCLSALDERTGATLWGPVDLGSPLMDVMVGSTNPPFAIAWRRRTSARLETTYDHLDRIDLTQGARSWTFAVSGSVGSNLLLHDSRLCFMDGNSLLRLDVDNGQVKTKTRVPAAMLDSPDIPDMLLPRSEMILLARERRGIAAFSSVAGDFPWYQDVQGTALFCYGTIKSLLPSADDAEAALTKAVEKDERWWSSWNSAINSQWSGGPGGGNSSSRFGANMALFQSTLALSAAIERSLKAAAIEGLIRRLQLSLANDQKLHLRSIQGDLFFRPFAKEGVGVCVVDVASGKRADFQFSAPNHGMKHMTMQLQSFALAADARRLVTTGIGLDPAKWQHYVKFKWDMPYPSLLVFDLGSLTFRDALWDDKALESAAGNGKLEMVKTILAAGAWVDSRDTNGNTALFAAAWKGHLEVVHHLLAQGADVNRWNDSFWLQSAIQAAATEGHVAVVAALLEAGADPRGALERATRNERGAVVELLQKRAAR